MINNNDFKYIIKRVIIGLAIAFILFNVNKCNAKALVYVRDIWNTPSPSSMSGYLANGNSVTQKFVLGGNTIYTQDADYDVLIINFDKIMVRGWNDEQNNTLNCTLVPQGSNSYITCNAYNSNITDGQYFLSGVLEFDDHVSFSPCYFSTEYGNAMVCPMYRRSNRAVYSFNLTLKNSGYSGVNYEIGINGLKNGYNYDSTEIVKGLADILAQQESTTNAIEDLNQNINDNNISGANNSTNSALSGIDNSVSNTLDNSISPNQLNTILTNFTNQLSNTTCSPITLPIPYTSENITLPCLGTEFSQRIPVIWALYELIITGVIVLRFWQHGVEFVLNILDPYHIGANNVPTGGGK